MGWCGGRRIGGCTSEAGIGGGGGHGNHDGYHDQAGSDNNGKMQESYLDERTKEIARKT